MNTVLSYKRSRIYWKKRKFSKILTFIRTLFPLIIYPLGIGTVKTELTEQNDTKNRKVASANPVSALPQCQLVHRTRKYKIRKKTHRYCVFLDSFEYALSKEVRNCKGSCHPVFFSTVTPVYITYTYLHRFNILVSYRKKNFRHHTVYFLASSL